MKRLLLILFSLITINVLAEDIRYQDSIVRDSDGTIHRSARVISDFKKIHPCPVNGNTEGSCPGWEVDHVIPLACKGKDEVFNLQWLPKEIKSAKGTLPKDRWERKVYCK